jgi:glycosyltransferase involved in cell wall biosynthesis
VSDSTSKQVRLAVYCDYPYRIENGTLSAEQPVGLFLGQLSRFCRLTMVGRYDRSPGSFPYVIEDADFVGLPHYVSGASARELLRSLPVSVRRFWRLLDRVDAVWLLGPVPLSVLFALLTLLRGKRLTLGVRQDLPRLSDHRHQGRPLLRLGARVLEASYRVLSLRAPVAVVGPQIAHNYRYARHLHTMYISLLRDRDLADDVAGDPRDYSGSELRMLSVGRIDPEKNPLLLADILAGAIQRDPRWTLDVCGEGPLSAALAQRFEELGVDDRATMRGHVPIDGGLLELYQRSHAFMHVSFSEGVPQVLLEAFATRLPVVATAVGGVPALVGGAGLLVEPGDADAAVEQLMRISGDEQLRRELAACGLESAREHTLESETARLAAFLLGSVSS